MKKIVFFTLTFFMLTINIQAKQNVTLLKCIDGDTAKFRKDNKEITVRFLAIDTPEIKHGKKDNEPYGIQASNFTCSALKSAKTIELEYDKNAGKDKYSRDLAWVFVDDILLQDSLIKKGYAKVAYLYKDYKYTKLLQRDEQLTKAKKIGLWSDYKQHTITLEEYIVIIISFIFIITIFFSSKKYRKKIIKKVMHSL